MIVPAATGTHRRLHCAAVPVAAAMMDRRERKEPTMTEQHAALTEAVVDSDDPIVRYKARRYLDGADPTSATMQRLRGDIADSPIARGLLADLDMSKADDRQGMSTIYLTFRYLADIDYPPGDDQLVPYRDHIYRWLRG